MRIPFSQLRFQGTSTGEWGINVSRYIHRKNETVWLRVRAPKNAERPGLAHGAPDRGSTPFSRGGSLEMLALRRRRAESSSTPRRRANPFNDGSRAFALRVST